MEDLLQIGYDKDDRDDERKDITILMVCRTQGNNVYIQRQFVGDEAERLYKILIGETALPREVDERIKIRDKRIEELTRTIVDVVKALGEWA